MAMTVVLSFIALVFVLMGLYQFWFDIGEQSQIYRAINPQLAAEATTARRSRLDRAIVRSRWGVKVQDSIAVSGMSISPSQFVLGAFLLCLILGLALGATLSWLLFPVGMYIGFLLIRGRLRKRREKRKEDFIGQMPELARTLSNASSAGLSIRTAVSMAADELAEPAHSELRTVADEINLGVPLDTAMTNLERRLPSRELGILVSSLVVSARSGGALVTALRDISDTLDTRKEVRREIRTVYAQTVATAYAVLGIGVLSLFMLEAINSGTVDAMLRNPLGQGALVFAVVVYGTALWAVRRMTKIEL